MATTERAEGTVVKESDPDGRPLSHRPPIG
jgi:hypothetical protein